jgi:peptide/nickel transport system substrate-binding protein
LCAALSILIAAGCSKRFYGAPPAANGIRIALTEPVSLNPLYLQGIASFEFSELGFSYLTTYSPDDRIVPDLAVRVPTLANGDISPNGKAIRFHLRRGIVWQDGAPLTARDVVFTYRAIVNPRNSIPSRYGYEGIASVTAPNPYTVAVRTIQPFSPIVSFFFGGDSNYPILPSHLLGRYPSLDRADFNQQPIGSGPYRYGAWRHGDGITLTPNDRYYAGKPRLARLDLRFIPASATVTEQLDTGEIDAAFFADVEQLPSLRSIPNHRIIVTPVPFVQVLIFNTRDPVLSDAKVRHAFAMGIDRRAVVDKTTYGLYGADTGMRGLFAWAYDGSAGNVRYDPRAAAALLQSDGWIAGPHGVRTKAGRPLEIQLSEYTGRHEPEDRMATLIAEQERTIGIDVTRKKYTVQQFFLTTGPIDRGRYQVALAQYQASGDPDASWLLACDQSAPRGFNQAFYCNHAVDAALSRAAKTFDRAARSRDYAFVQRQLLADLPYYFISQVSEVDVVPTWLQGYDRPLLSPLASVARWQVGRPGSRR